MALYTHTHTHGNLINNVGADDSVCPRNKGITLIALIITIIVLLILTVVSINLLINEGIIGNANKAVKQYQEAEFEEKIGLIFSSHVMAVYTGENINYKKVVNDILDIFNYPNINEETGALENEEEGTTDTYTMTAEDGLVNIVSPSQETLLKIKYNESLKSIKIYYNGKIWEYEDLKLKSKENMYVEYNAPEEVEGTAYKSGLWQYTKNETGTLTITKYLGTTEEELTDVVVPNKINGQIVEYFDGFGKNLTGTLTISRGLKTAGDDAGTKRATIGANKLIIEEDVVIQNERFFHNSTIDMVEIKDSVILNAYGIFAWVPIKKIKIDNNVQILNNALFYSQIEELNMGENCTIETTISETQKIIIGDNAKININLTETLIDLTIGNNAIMNGFSGATSLKDVKIGENCSLNGKSLFANCSSLTDNDVYTILKNSNKIEAYGLFYNCDSLVNVTIPANKSISRTSVAGAERYMFEGCDNLNRLSIEENSVFLNPAVFNYSVIQELIIEDNVKFVDGNTFGGSKKLKSVSIGKYCHVRGMQFNFCSVENLKIGVGTEGNAVTFNGCTSIKNVEYYLTEEQINLCKESLDNVNTIINAVAMLKTIINNNTLTATFEEDKIVLTKTT